MADLIVRELGTRKEVSRVDVTGKSERTVERVMLGMLANMSERYFIDDSEVDAAREKTAARKDGKSC